LKELSLKLKTVRDDWIKLHAAGFLTFKKAGDYFERLLKSLDSFKETYPALLPSRGIFSRSPPDPSAELKQRLKVFHEWISKNAKGLLLFIDEILPVIEEASVMGGTIMEDFMKEKERVNRDQGHTNIWTQIFNGEYVGNLQKDFDLTTLTIRQLMQLRRELEGLREMLLTYESNLTQFSGELTGFHETDHGLSADAEVQALFSTLATYQSRLKESSSRKKSRVDIDSLPAAKYILGDK